MNSKLVFQGAAAACLTLALSLGAAATTAGASPLAASGAAAKASPQAMVVEIQSQKARSRKAKSQSKSQKQRARRSVRHAPAPQLSPDDRVVTIIHDGKGYGYNRFTGERYMKCMIDLGYGRVEPCDRGDGGSWN